jgi:hypothetical protein
MSDDDECEAVGGMIGKGTRNNQRKPASVPVHHKSQMTWSGLEPGPLRWEATDKTPEQWNGLLTIHTKPVTINTT